MSPRAVTEWIGKSADTKAPPRVLLRVFEREGGICHISGRKIMTGEPWQADHKIALINGGENRESNLFPALVDKHKEKTKADVAEKSRVASLAKSNIGATPDKPKIQSRVSPKVERTHAGRGPAIGMSEIFRRYGMETGK